MRIYVTIILLLVSFVINSQPIVNRAAGSNTVQDARWSAQLNMFMPRYLDTTAANLSKGVDSCGALIFTYLNNQVWQRSCNPKRWETISGGGPTDSLIINDILPHPPTSVVMNSSGMLFKSQPYQIYNVKDYGAVGDGVTNDRTAIQNTINACFAGGGGVVYFPNGVYYLGSGTVQKNGQLYIPYSDYNTSTTNPTIVFRGESPTPQNYNPLQAGGSNRLPSLKGVILQSGATQSENVSIITSMGAGGVTWEAMNFTRFEMENITVRMNARNNAGAAMGVKDTAINGFALSVMQLNGVTVDVNCPNDSVSQPDVASVGIISPSNSNWVTNSYNNVWVIGQYKGFIAYEHANMDNFYWDACYYGLVLENTNHSIHGNRIGFWRVKRAILVNASSPYTPGLTVDQYNNERYSFADEWFEFEYDLVETNPGQSWGFLRCNMVSGTFDFVRSNPAGSRIFSTGMGGNGYKWTTVNTPSFADTATFGMDLTIQHYVFKPRGPASNDWNVIAHAGQTRDFWSAGVGKLAQGGNPGTSTYRFTIYDSVGAAPNMIHLYSAASPNIKIETSGAASQSSIQFSKSGTVVSQFGMNFNADTQPDIYLYDQTNALAKIYIPLNTSDMYLGGNAFTGTGMTILNSGNTGIRNNAPGTTTLVVNDGDKSGTPTPSRFYSILDNSTDANIINGVFKSTQTAAMTGSIQGVEGYVEVAHTLNTVSLAIGTIGNVEVSGTSTLTEGRGGQFGFVSSGNGTVGNAVSLAVATATVSGAATPTITNSIGINIGSPSAGSSGTITNHYGIYVNPIGAGTFSNRRIGINLENFGSTDSSYQIWSKGGKIRFDDMQTTTTDTTNYKPVGIDANGILREMTYWPGGGSGQAVFENSGTLDTLLHPSVTGDTLRIKSIDVEDGYGINDVATIGADDILYTLSVDTLQIASWGRLYKAIDSLAATGIGGGVSSITGTANQVLVDGTSGSAETGAVTLTLPQSIATSSTPQFSQLGVGAASNAAYRLNAGGSGMTSGVLLVNGTLAPSAGAEADVTYISGGITEAGSGNHTRLSGTYMVAPIITGAAATVTNTGTLIIQDAPSATVSGNNHSLWVQAGASRLDGNVGVGIFPAVKFHTSGAHRYASMGGTTTDIATYMPMGINSSGDVLSFTGWPEVDQVQLAIASMGGDLKAQSIGVDLASTTTGNNASPTDGRLVIVPIWLNKAQTITGVRLIQGTAANGVTQDNENRVALATYNSGTGNYTVVASSANNATLWTAAGNAGGATNNVLNEAFSTPYAASAGLYFVLLLYNQSAGTPPSFAAPTDLGNAIRVTTSTYGLTNSAKFKSFLASQSTLPSSFAASSTTADTDQWWVGVY